MFKVKSLKKIISIFFAFGLILNASISSATEKEAIDFVNDLAARAIEITKSSTLSDHAKEEKLTNIFLKAVDTRFIAKFALAKYWRTITPVQQDTYANLYSQYLVGMYVPNFRKYTGNVVTVTNAKEVRENDYIVQTVLGSGTNEQNIQISYMMKKAPNGIEKFKIYDIIAEGVSLITTQRDEIGSIMTDNNGNFDNLLELLKQKTAQK